MFSFCVYVCCVCVLWVVCCVLCVCVRVCLCMSACACDVCSGICGVHVFVCACTCAGVSHVCRLKSPYKKHKNNNTTRSLNFSIQS